MKLPIHPTNIRTLSLHAIYLAAAIAFTIAYTALTNEYVAAPFDSLVHFTGRTPFQFRLLPLLIANAIEHIHPVSPRIVFGVMTIAATYFLLVEYAKFLGLFLSRLQAGWLAPLILYPIFWNYIILNGYLYPSDIPAILFFTIGLRALYTENWKLYSIVFLVGLVNRESICFLSAAFAIAQLGRMDKGEYCISLGIQAAIWALYKLALSSLFRGNPGAGDLYLPHWVENLDFVRQMAGDRTLIAQFAVTFGAIWLLIPYGWRDQPPFVRKMLLLVPVVFAGMWFVGNLHEVRIYGELIPILTTSASLGFRSCLVGPPKPPAPYDDPATTSASPALDGAILAAALLFLLAALVSVDWNFNNKPMLWDIRDIYSHTINMDGIAIAFTAMGIGLIGKARLLKIEKDRLSK
jgi:hypothetical protein